MYTLEYIYNRLETNTQATKRAGAFIEPGAWLPFLGVQAILYWSSTTIANYKLAAQRDRIVLIPE
jgi:hypothetical protein